MEVGVPSSLQCIIRERSRLDYSIVQCNAYHYGDHLDMDMHMEGI
jgi:hypothetical protein